MHKVLLPFIFDELCYLSNADLIEILKRTDNSYYLDDINFLSLHSSQDVICGYFPDCDPATNFYYAIARRNPVQETAEIYPPSQAILTCTDFECLERFLDLICTHKPPLRRISINLPYSNERIINADDSKTVREKLNILMKKYNQYFCETSCLYDYRFDCFPHMPSVNYSPQYRIEETNDNSSKYVFDVYENDMLLFQYIPNVFSYVNSIIPALRQPAEDRLGMKAVSFSDNVINISQDKLPNDAIQFCLSAVSSIFLKRGYVVKNIALHSQFENEDICAAIGMTRFRQFVYYKALF